LTTVRTTATHVRITANEPNTYALATTGSGSTQMLGFKSWGVNNAFTATSAGSPSGRQTTSVAISDGTIVTTGTAGWWAVTDESTNARLLAHGSLSTTQSVTSGTNFNLAAFSIKVPAAISG
jgi:hypothetical protein